jgi:hypothetical protein
MCHVQLPDGCYRLTYRPTTSSDVYRGALRVDRAQGRLVISGDLYRFMPGSDVAETGPAVRTLRSAVGFSALADRDADNRIPVYPRGRYHSYL